MAVSTETVALPVKNAAYLAGAASAGGTPSAGGAPSAGVPSPGAPSAGGAGKGGAASPAPTIYIEGISTDDKNITFTIYGMETRDSGRQVIYESEVISQPAPSAATTLFT